MRGLYKNQNWFYQRYCVEMKSMKEIAEELNIGIWTVRNNLKKHKILTRNRSEAYKNWLRNNLHPSKGKKLTAECKKKISKALKGRILSNETIKKINDFHRGRKRNKQTKINISMAITGRKLSLEHREKFSIMRSGKGNGMYGKKHAESTKEKIRQKALGKKQSKELIEKRFKAIQKRPTKPEAEFNILTSNDIRYVGNGKWWRWLPNGKYKNPDFKITNQNKVIEIFGDYWHRNDDPQKLIDLYKLIGIDCLVIWEKEIKTQPRVVLDKVNNFMEI